MHGGQQLRVIARYSDGREADVTAPRPLPVEQRRPGLGQRHRPGQRRRRARRGGGHGQLHGTPGGHLPRRRAARRSPSPYDPTCPRTTSSTAWSSPKLRKLNVAAVRDLCDDADFLRRVYLDVIGTLPTPAEAPALPGDTRPRPPRPAWSTSCCERPEYADYWARNGPTCCASIGRRWGTSGPTPTTSGSARAWPPTSRSTSSPARSSTAEGPLERGRAGQLLQGGDASPARRPARCRRSSSACASPAPSAIIIRSTAGARPTTTACRRSSPRWRCEHGPRGEVRAGQRRPPWPRHPRTGAVRSPPTALAASRCPRRRRPATAGRRWPTG